MRTAAQKHINQILQNVSSPIPVQIGIDGLSIDADLKAIIYQHYTSKLAFALRSDDHHCINYFLPQYGVAVFWNGHGLTLHTFHDESKFQDCIKLALVASRQFVGARSLPMDDRYNQVLLQVRNATTRNEQQGA